jgi:GTPase SAR1 family protein
LIEIPDPAEPVDVMIWDTPGRENLHPLPADAFLGADMWAIVYDLADCQSFEAVPQLIEKVKVVSPTVQVVVVENEVDLVDGGRAELDEAQRIATQLETPLFGSSALVVLNI